METRKRTRSCSSPGEKRQRPPRTKDQFIAELSGHVHARDLGAAMRTVRTGSMDEKRGVPTEMFDELGQALLDANMDEELASLCVNVLLPAHESRRDRRRNVEFLQLAFDLAFKMRKARKDMLSIARAIQTTSERVYGWASKNNQQSLLLLEAALFDAEMLDEALVLARQSLELCRELYEPSDVRTCTAMVNLGWLLRHSERDQAIELIRCGAETIETMLGPEHMETADALADLFFVLAMEMPDDLEKLRELECLGKRAYTLAGKHAMQMARLSIYVKRKEVAERIRQKTGE